MLKEENVILKKQISEILEKIKLKVICIEFK